MLPPTSVFVFVMSLQCLIVQSEGFWSDMLLDKKHKIILSWSPKAACTKMVEMFWNEMGLYRGEYYPRKSWIHKYRPQFYKEFGRVTEKLLEDPSYYKFKVVRNPWDRAVSSYNHIMVTGQGGYFFNNTVLRNFLTKRKFVYPPESDGLSFEKFLEIFDILDGSPIQNSYKQESRDLTLSHFRPQVSDVEIKKWVEGGHFFNRVVKLENFENDISLVNKEAKMNYSFPLGSDHHDAHRHQEADMYLGNKSWSQLKSNVPVDYAKYYNRLTQKLVLRLFRNDIRVYNYSYPFDRVY